MNGTHIVASKSVSRRKSDVGVADIRAAYGDHLNSARIMPVELSTPAFRLGGACAPRPHYTVLTPAALQVTFLS
jgi:hypothetical protein